MMDDGGLESEWRHAFDRALAGEDDSDQEAREKRERHWREYSEWLKEHGQIEYCVMAYLSDGRILEWHWTESALLWERMYGNREDWRREIERRGEHELKHAVAAYLAKHLDVTIKRMRSWWIDSTIT